MFSSNGTVDCSLCQSPSTIQLVVVFLLLLQHKCEQCGQVVGPLQGEGLPRRILHKQQSKTDSQFAAFNLMLNTVCGGSPFLTQ